MRIETEPHINSKSNGAVTLFFPVINKDEVQVGSLILTSNQPKRLNFWLPLTLDDITAAVSAAEAFHVADFSKCGVDKRCNCG